MTRRYVILGVLALLGLIVVSTSWYTVDQGELGVRLRNGAAIGTAQPGLHFQLPFIDSVVLISTRTERAHYDRVESYSKDIQAADLRITINYRADTSRAEQIYAEFGSLEGAVVRLLTPLVFSEIKIVFGRYNAASAISERGRMVLEMEQAIRSNLGDESGLILEGVQLENIDFSDAFEHSVEQRMLAEVEVAKRRQELEREKVQADIVRTQAGAEADRVRAAAQAEADAIRLRGEAEALAIKARGDALRENPNLIDLVIAEQWNGALPSTMPPNGTVPFLNLRTGGP